MQKFLEELTGLLPVLAGELIALSGLAVWSLFRRRAPQNDAANDARVAARQAKLERLAALAH